MIIKFFCFCSSVSFSEGVLGKTYHPPLNKSGEMRSAYVSLRLFTGKYGSISIKIFVKLLKDKEVLQQCEAFSKFIKSEICDTYDDMENSCTRTSTTGYLPEVCTCRQNVREVIEGALLFIENITKLYLCGQREVTIKHALQNNDYGPLNRLL